MPAIIVIDDRASIRKQIAALTKAALPRGTAWEVREMAPFPDINDYATWLAEHQDVAVMVLDENLQEQGDETVSYNGHEVVEKLRPVEPDFPIFIVTSFSTDELQQQSGPSVEGIIDREKFFGETKTHVARMVRAGQRFSTALESDLNRLGELSGKVARGEANEEDHRALTGVRQKLSLPFSTDEVTYSKDLIPKAEALIQEAHELIAKIKAERVKK